MPDPNANSNSESDKDNKKPWYQKPDTWVSIIFIVFLLVMWGCFWGYVIYKNQVGQYKPDSIQTKFRENMKEFTELFKQLETVEVRMKELLGKNIRLKYIQSYWYDDLKQNQQVFFENPPIDN